MTKQSRAQSMMKTKDTNSYFQAAELSIITRLYDFILWALPQINKFPRSQRFVLGERIERTLFDILEMMIEAKYTRSKAKILAGANVALEKLRFQVRMAKDMNFLSLRRYHYAAGQINEVGRQPGAWIKTAK